MEFHYLARKDFVAAENSFKKAIRINPDIEYKKYNGLARRHMAQGKHEEARAVLQKSTENHAFDNEANKMLVELENKLKSTKK